jgi:hypothetical protein
MHAVRPLALALALLPLLLADLAPAHGAASGAPVQERDDDLARSARRVLHLADGRAWLGVARRVDGAWELQREGRWTRLPAGSVLRHAREADLLRELSRRERELEGDGADALVDLAAWLLDEGLPAEALARLDRALRLAPNHAGALQLLRERRPARVPGLGGPGPERADARERLLAWAAQATPALRELCLLELEAADEPEATRALLLDALGASSPHRRLVGAHGLGRLHPGAAPRRLLQHAVLDASARVRAAAAAALGAADEPDLVVPVVRALASANPRVRVQAAAALGHMGYPVAVEPLVGYVTTVAAAGDAAPVPHGYYFHGVQRAFVQDFDVEVATFQAVADPQVNALVEGEVLEAGVLASTVYDRPTELRAGREALERLTGERPGRTSRAWREWWAERGADWRDRHAAVRETRRDG